MGFPLKKTPATVKVRILRNSNRTYKKDDSYSVIKRVGRLWRVIGKYETRDEAVSRVLVELELLKLELFKLELFNQDKIINLFGKKKGEKIGAAA